MQRWFGFCESSGIWFHQKGCSPSVIQGKIAGKLSLIQPALPVPSIPEMEKVRYEGEPLILGTQRLLKLQSLEEKG